MPQKVEPWVIRTAQTKVTTKFHILTQLWHIFEIIFRRVWHNFHATIILTFILGVLACSHDASFSSRLPEYAGKSCHFYLGPHAKPLSGVTVFWHDLHQQQEKCITTRLYPLSTQGHHVSFCIVAILFFVLLYFLFCVNSTHNVLTCGNRPTHVLLLAIS